MIPINHTIVISEFVAAPGLEPVQVIVCGGCRSAAETAERLIQAAPKLKEAADSMLEVLFDATGGFMADECNCVCCNAIRAGQRALDAVLPARKDGEENGHE